MARGPASILLLWLVMASLFAPAGLSSHTRTESQAYVATLGYGQPRCDAEDVNAGGACFQLTGEETQVTVEIDDQRVGPVGGTYWFLDRQGQVIDEGTFCSTSHLIVPGLHVDQTAEELRVGVDGPLTYPNGCQGPFPMPGSRGQVRARFSFD